MDTALIDDLLDSELFSEAESKIAHLPDANLQAVYRLEILLKQGDYPRADDFYRNAPIDLSSPVVRLRYYLDVGDLHFRLGRNSRSLEYLSKVISEYNNLGSEEHRRLYAGALNLSGLVHSDMGDDTEAMKFFQDAYQVQKSLDYPHDRISILNNMGLIYTKLGKYSSALDVYNRAYQTATELGDQKRQAALLNNLSILYRRQGQWGEALEKSELSLRICREITNLPLEAQILNSLGAIHIEIGKESQALEYFIKSLGIKENIGNPSEIGIACINIGIVLLEIGRFNEATEYLDRAFSIPEIKGSKRLKYYILESKASISRYRGEYQQTLEYLLEGLPLQKEIGNPGDIAHSYYSLAGVYHLLEKNREALDMLTHAKHYLEEVPRSIVRADIIVLEVMIYNSIGLLSKCQSCVEELKVLADETSNVDIKTKYELVESILLIDHGDSDSLSRASELLKSISENPDGSYSTKVLALQFQCLLLINRLRYDPSLISKAQALVTEVMSIANRRSSYAQVIEGYILQSKLSFVQGDFTGAEKLLEEGRVIAQKNNMPKALRELNTEIARQRVIQLDTDSVQTRLSASEADEYIKQILKLKSEYFESDNL